jgi:hypothetical protein
MNIILNGYNAFPNLKILVIRFYKFNQFNINGINGINTPHIKRLKDIVLKLSKFTQL